MEGGKHDCCHGTCKKYEVTISPSAEAFDVPHKTLDDHINGRVEHGTNPRSSTALSKEKKVYSCFFT